MKLKGQQVSAWFKCLYQFMLQMIWIWALKDRTVTPSGHQSPIRAKFYLTMLGWSNFSSCLSKEISLRMAIGTPSSVNVNRIFFSATISSVDRSRARYTVPYAPGNRSAPNLEISGVGGTRDVQWRRWSKLSAYFYSSLWNQTRVFQTRVLCHPPSHHVLDQTSLKKLLYNS